MSATTSLPTAVAGRFGAYGGRYVPETLMAALEELEELLLAADLWHYGHRLVRTVPAARSRVAARIGWVER